MSDTGGPGTMSWPRSSSDLDAIEHNVRTLARVAAPGRRHGDRQGRRLQPRHGRRGPGFARCGGAVELGSPHWARPSHCAIAGMDAPVTAWMWLPDPELEDIAAAIDREITLGMPSVAPAFGRFRRRGKRWPTGRRNAEGRVDGGHGVVAFRISSRHRWDEAVSLAATAVRGGVLAVTGVLSHLASADDPNPGRRTCRRTVRRGRRRRAGPPGSNCR
jgi:alanine racemase